MAMLRIVAALLLIAPGAHAMTTESEAMLKANPIRKVVTMLQNMQKKISAEAGTKEKMFDQYMCYCKNADSTLAKSIADAEDKVPQVESAIKEDSAMKKQLKADLADAKSGRAEAKETLAKAAAIRAKEEGAYSKAAAESKTNIAALSKAIPAIEQGMSSSFLQTQSGTATVLRRLSVSMDMNTADRDLLASFLEEGSTAPGSGEIVGILKQMKDEMDKDLADAVGDETGSVASYESLVAAKKKEIAALTKAIETKTVRVGELSVKVAEAENDLEDTKEGLAEDKKFLADLDGNCALKQKEWEAYKKVNAEEMVALADTIKVLNDDDTLELMKKTLPSASSFMQLQVTSKALKKQASAILRHARGDPRLDFVQVALHGGQMGFNKIIKMIDGLIVTLNKDASNDSDKKKYCLAEFDKTEDTKKGLVLDRSDLEKAIADGKESMATLAGEIKALVAGIKALDTSVADATAQRKEEHDEFVSVLASNTAAKDILAFAKNRLNKFYNPKMYKAPPKRQLSEEDQITVNNGGTLAPTAAPGGIAGTGIGLAQVAPPPPPAADMSSKPQESSGVLAMIDLLVADIEKENQVMNVEEKDAQSDYEKLISDSAEKRALDSKAITDKEGAKAGAEAEVQAADDSFKSKSTELMETDKYLSGLHQDCDWLLKFFDTRQTARNNEIDALGKAKDVLSGADYSLVQTSRVVHLRGGRA